VLARPTAAKVSSPFGWRWNYTDWHGGIDFAAPLGSPVYAVHPGVVLGVFPNGTLNKYGNTVVVKHDMPADAPYALYAHLKSYGVKKGDRVSLGQLIARSGNTAGTHADPSHTFAPHLHFELLSAWPPAKPDQYRVDPTPYLDLSADEVAKGGAGLGSLLALGGLWWWLRKRRRR
jgi:murein DD-endopeptidase MepM/ murein hydrolase activator NlpD